MRFYLLLLFPLVFFGSCTGKYSEEEPIQKLFGEHEQRQIERYHAQLVSAGVPSEDAYETIALHYVVFKKMKIPEARELIVDNVEDLLQRVNHDPEVEKKLGKHPLSYKDIEFNVAFATTDGEFQSPPYVAYAYLKEGTITYCYHDELFGDFTDEEDVQEPYPKKK